MGIIRARYDIGDKTFIQIAKEKAKIEHEQDKERIKKNKSCQLRGRDLMSHVTDETLIANRDKVMRHILKENPGYFDVWLGHVKKFRTAKQIRKQIMSELQLRPEFGLELAELATETERIIP